MQRIRQENSSSRDIDIKTFATETGKPGEIYSKTHDKLTTQMEKVRKSIYLLNK